MLKTLLLVACSATIVAAQTAPGFAPNVDEPMPLTLSPKGLSTVVGYVYTPAVRARIYEWRARQNDPLIEKVNIPQAVTAPIVHVAFKSFHPTLLEEFAESILIGDLGAVLMPHGKDLNGRAAQLLKVDHPDIMKRYPLGFPFPAWEAAATMATDAIQIAALDPRLATMDIMAVATFPLEKWRPGNLVVVYQVRWWRGSVFYTNHAGDVRAID